MKKVVATLILASLVSSSAVYANSVTDYMGNLGASASATVQANPKTVGGIAAGVVLVAGVAVFAKKYPQGSVANNLRKVTPEGWWADSNSSQNQQAS